MGTVALKSEFLGKTDEKNAAEFCRVFLVPLYVYIGNYSVNSTQNFESHFSRELRVCPPPNNVCQQNVEVTRSDLEFKIC